MPHRAAATASIPVVGFNAVLMSEHFGAFFTCAVLHGVFFVSRACAMAIKDGACKQQHTTLGLLALLCSSGLD